MKLSVIVPTHNRPDKLAETLAGLRHQDLPAADYEIIVVDDGSRPPVAIADGEAGPACALVRVEGVERSAARNAGAAIARGELLVFVDDDLTVGHDFLSAHWRAHQEWPEALIVGAVRLPDEALATPFGRFRQRLEQQAVPRRRGLTAQRNFCTAANLSLPKQSFQRLGGFDPALCSSEDQDLALRHTAGGGEIAFLPEAEAVHCDGALDIRRYCRRAAWGAGYLVAFCRKHPDWPENIARERINGPVHWGAPLLLNARKLVKSALAFRPVLAVLFALAALLERLAPQSAALDRVYRLLLGAHLLRGYRSGLKRRGRAARSQSPISRTIAADAAAPRSAS
jgi:glycosyltransferase involved in cell wall biosynthesis